ncbi:arabinosyltransferase domain-containing protein [Corynebacterium testudinoris]|uniref:Cell wall arabinan synthesis protein n=1 Tax=Corynebacterium testudinoris TaxID=136857 RepID=A0A0G3H728_9CORY|nr:arabinosyltransferase domain-containing protein [Corynebacterium testudinoris]AKK07613.1 cell wall arabinan synthesis protein [Corynebacterium testudinoris]
MSATVISKKEAPQSSSATAPGWLKNLAIISGLLGFVLFILTPFLPVNQTQSSLSWPQGDSLNSVNAPLVAYAPETLELSIPIKESIAGLRDGESLVVSTLPPDSTDATSRGLFVRSSDGGINVVVRNQVPFELDADEVAALNDDAVLTVSSTEKETKVAVPGATNRSGDALEGVIEDEDTRPQVTGIYTELDDSPAATAALTDAGLQADVEINSRFTSSPSALKYIAMFGGLASLIVALWCLHRMDSLDGRSSRRFLPAGWYKPRPLDGIVGFILIYWHIFGANTSDDGFILTMARVSENATYMANYYRWFGVPESPFGSPYYDLLALMTQVSTASAWVRLPALLSGLIIWLILSREILPRLGAQIDGRQVAHWTAAMVFLSFWLPYNNGTRPEPIIAMGALLTWASFERSIATSRLLPAAVGVLLATICLGAGPTGLMAVAALLASLSSLFRIMFRRLPLLGAPTGSSRGTIITAVLAMVAPFLASGTAILVAVFGDQTWATVMESIRVRSAKGPSLSWYQEWVRYQTLMEQTVDGSMTRRFAVFMLFLSLAIVIAAILRNGRVPGAAKGPTQRLVLIIFGTMFFLMFTPTKWTHHFGVYAGIVGALAALAAVALSYSALRSTRSRTLFTGAVIFLLAITFSGTNGWWYISSFGVPWFDKTVQLKGFEASTPILFLALAVLALGTIQSFVTDLRVAKAETEGNLDEYRAERKQKLQRWTGLSSAPIAIACALMVAFSMASLGKGFISQYPAYSVGLGNVRSLAGQSCSLANDALLETNTNDSFLTPVDNVPLAESLESESHRGFAANNIPSYIGQDEASTTSVGAIADAERTGEAEQSTGQDSGTTGGVRGEVGVNGSTVKLPFKLDYHQVPVVGSWTSGQQMPAEITTAWYELPQATEDAPLVVVSVAGRIEHHDINGVLHDGQELVLEYGTRGPDGQIDESSVGELEMFDIGPQPSWRNLRFPLDRIPEEANVVRISATDLSLDPKQWLAFTPPRVPTLDSLNNIIGSEKPGLLDWSVALQFPCQRTFDHFAGVAEIPEYRISPDHPGKSTLTPFQDYAGGGVMGTAEGVNESYELPSYTRNDWHRDWGSIEIYELRENSAGITPDEAEIDLEVIPRSGLWSPSKMMIATS